MTLVELAMVVTIAGTLAVGIVAAAGSAADRAEVTLMQGRVLEAYRQGQAAAMARGGPVAVVVAVDSVVVRGLSGDSAVLYRAPGPGSRSIVLSPASHRAVFERSGLAAGLANVTHRLSRGQASRQVVVSRLGRLRAN